MQADKHTTYKVIYIARHGEGWHNRAEEKYGTEEWNRRWSRLEGDGEMVVRRFLPLFSLSADKEDDSGVPTPSSHPSASPKLKPSTGRGKSKSRMVCHCRCRCTQVR